MLKKQLNSIEKLNKLTGKEDSWGCPWKKWKKKCGPKYEQKQAAPQPVQVAAPQQVQQQPILVIE